MKIALNCIYFTPKAGGIKEYIYNLVSNLESISHKHKIIYYITRRQYDDFSKLVDDKSKIRIFPYEEEQKYLRSIFQQNFWRKEEKKEGFQIFHSPFFHSPNFKYANVILTIHDLRFLVYPHTYIFPRLVYLKFQVKRSIKRAKKIIAISEFTKNEIIKYYKIDPSRIEVIHEAVNKKEFTLENNEKTRTINGYEIKRDKYLLAVGHLEPRKNYSHLINAYSKLEVKIKKAYKLIIVGKKDHDFLNTLKEVEKTKGVIYLDFIPRDDLVWLYSNCKLHVFPSVYEGFGFPCLEAGISGKPTVGSNQSSIPEIAGEGGIYFNPFLTEDIKDKIEQVLSNDQLYKNLSQRAFINTEKFSWYKNAKDTLKIYNHFEK